MENALTLENSIRNLEQLHALKGQNCNNYAQWSAILQFKNDCYDILHKSGNADLLPRAINELLEKLVKTY